MFYDITASSDKRNIMLDVVSEVAKQIFIPFSVGGGIRTLEDINALLRSGVEKINVNSAAVKLPTLIDECAGAIGRQNTVLSMDVRRVESMACSSAVLRSSLMGDEPHGTRRCGMGERRSRSRCRGVSCQFD